MLTFPRVGPAPWVGANTPGTVAVVSSGRADFAPPSISRPVAVARNVKGLQRTSRDTPLPVGAMQSGAWLSSLAIHPGNSSGPSGSKDQGPR